MSLARLFPALVLIALAAAAFDGVLSLYDNRGRPIATVDDGHNGRDPLKATLPQDGEYVLVLIDANDRGGVTHPYLLELRGE
jgi:hypothetical protein